MKNHFGDVEVMRTKLDVKDEELKEIKKQLKIKVWVCFFRVGGGKYFTEWRSESLHSMEIVMFFAVEEVTKVKIRISVLMKPRKAVVIFVTVYRLLDVDPENFSLYFQQEELSEQQVRLGLMEKKLENASKEADDRVEKIQRKLDEANVQFKKKEKLVLFFFFLIVICKNRNP